MNSDNTFKASGKHILGMALILVSLSIITIFAIMYSINALDQPTFKLPTWLGVVTLLLVIVCAWRVVLNMLQPLSDAVRTNQQAKAEELDENFESTDDEFGKLTH